MNYIQSKASQHIVFKIGVILPTPEPLPAVWELMCWGYRPANQFPVLPTEALLWCWPIVPRCKDEGGDEVECVDTIQPITLCSKPSDIPTAFTRGPAVSCTYRILCRVLYPLLQTVPDTVLYTVLCSTVPFTVHTVGLPICC